MTTFDELFAEHNLTPKERKALVMHLATLRAQKTVAALQDCPLASAPSTPPPAVVEAVPTWATVLMEQSTNAMLGNDLRKAMREAVVSAQPSAQAVMTELEQRLIEIAKTLPQMTTLGWNDGGMCEPDEAIKGYTKKQILEILAQHLSASPQPEPSAQYKEVGLFIRYSGRYATGDFVGEIQAKYGLNEGDKLYRVIK